jgi:hypothetical protein
VHHPFSKLQSILMLMVEIAKGVEIDKKKFNATQINTLG